MMHTGLGLLVVGRIRYGARRIRDPIPGFSEDEVRRVYGGVDGEYWPGDPAAFGVSIGASGLSPLHELDKVRAYAKANSKNTEADLVVVRPISRGNEEIESAVERWSLRRSGYDVGFVHSESGTYSILFHEVIYPRFPELQRFASDLNDRLLLDSEISARELVGAIDELKGRGFTFEDPDPIGEFLPIEVFTLSSE